MTTEDAIKVFVESNLKVETQIGDDEVDFVVRGDRVEREGQTIYHWQCWLSQRESECIVEPPHPWNDPPLGFVVSNIAAAVSLILYMYEHRLSPRPAVTLESAEYAHQLEEATKHTQCLYDAWRELQA